MEPLNVVDRTDEGNTQRHEKAPPRDVDVDVGGSSRDDDAGGDVSNTSSLCNSVGCHQSAQLLVPARVSARSSTVMCLVVNREWREMNGITHDEVCAACTTAECCSWRTQKEVECPQCCPDHRPLVRITPIHRVPHNVPDSKSEEYQFEIKGNCSSSRMHLQVSALFLVVTLRDLKVISGQFQLQARALTAKTYHKKNKRSPSVSSGGDSSPDIVGTSPECPPSKRPRAHTPKMPSSGKFSRSPSRQEVQVQVQSSPSKLVLSPEPPPGRSVSMAELVLPQPQGSPSAAPTTEQLFSLDNTELSYPNSDQALQSQLVLQQLKQQAFQQELYLLQQRIAPSPAPAVVQLPTRPSSSHAHLPSFSPSFPIPDDASLQQQQQHYLLSDICALLNQQFEQQQLLQQQQLQTQFLLQHQPHQLQQLQQTQQNQLPPQQPQQQSSQSPPPFPSFDHILTCF